MPKIKKKKRVPWLNYDEYKQGELPFPPVDPELLKADRIRRGQAIIEKLNKKYPPKQS